MFSERRSSSNLIDNKKNNVNNQFITNSGSEQKLKSFKKSKSLSLPNLKVHNFRLNNMEKEKTFIQKGNYSKKPTLKNKNSEDTIYTFHIEINKKKELSKKEKILKKLYGENNDLLERINKFKKKNNKIALSSNFNVINYQGGLLNFAAQNCSDESLNTLLNNLQNLNEQINFKFSFKKTRWQLLGQKLSRKIPKYLADKLNSMGNIREKKRNEKIEIQENKNIVLEKEVKE